MRTLIAIAACLLTTGCLASSYIIPPAELDRIRTISPAQRARKLHVVQRFSTNDEPPPAPPMRMAPTPHPMGPTPEMGAPIPPGYYPDYYSAWGGPTWMPWRGGFIITSGSGGGPAPVGAVGAGQTTSGSGGFVPKNSASSGLAKSLSGTKVDDAKAAAAIAVIAGVGLGIGLAVTEGARFDGDVAVHPDHPVHLLGPNGSHRIAPLSALPEAQPQRWEEAVIVRHEGIGMWQLGRAPLDRRGLTYSMEFGSRAVPVTADRLVGTTAFDLHIGLFPHHMLGLVAGVSLAFGEDGIGDVFGLTPRFELQAIPLSIGWLHVGVFGGAAAESIDAEFIDGNTAGVRTMAALAFDAGVLLQVELTTRLAATFRWGASRWSQGYSGPTPQKMAFGLSVY